jgi:hypothetical protein
MWPLILEWLQAHRVLLQWLGLSSLVLFVLTLIAVPWVVIRLPQNYLVETTNNSGKPLRLETVPYRIAKNIFGSVFVLSGMAMLFLPGQGLLTILIGLTLLDFPGKPRLFRRILAERHILNTINNLRRRAHRPPLDIPTAKASREQL